MAKVKMILIGVLILTLFSPFQVNADQAGSTVFEILPPTIAGGFGA